MRRFFVTRSTEWTWIRSPAFPFLSRRDVPNTSLNWVSAALINGKVTMVISLLMVAVGLDDIERYFFVGGSGRQHLFEAAVVKTSAVSTGLCGSRRGGGESLTC